MSFLNNESSFLERSIKSNILLLFLIVNVSVLSAQITTSGSETKANTTTTNSQQHARVAMDGSGNYLIVWESDEQDGHKYGIFGQWYNADGTTNGSEFQVNTVTENDQRFPAVAVTEDGRSSIVWMEDEEDGSGWTVKCRIYNSSHASVTSAFSIRTSSNGQQRWPDVHMDASGNSIITWTQVSNDLLTYLVYANVRDASGNDVVSTFQVNDASSSFNGYSKAAAEENGDFAIVWQSLGSDVAGTHGILCERFNSSGTSQGTEFTVNTTGGGNQTSPDIAMDSTGNFTVVWTSAGQDGDGDGIYGQRYTECRSNRWFRVSSINNYFGFSESPVDRHVKRRFLCCCVEQLWN